MAELSTVKDDSTGGLLGEPKGGTAPFEGEGKTYEVTKPINPAQLIDEVYDRLANRQKYQVVIHVVDFDKEVSKDNPATIHVHPADADMRTVRGAVESHVPDPDFGMTQEQVELRDLRTRLATEDLTVQELNTIMRSIAGTP